ncbi:MAG: ankyrin repeat domain-containing protein [Holosporales bacterium]|jgi:ankyrin repeat protein|nr:ankyrin repeat domain-containing protein [Holosporales bacterium]
MKRFYKTMALVSLLGISNFSYGTFHGARAGWTPLHDVAYEGNVRSVRGFLDFGANMNVDVQDNYGNTPLHCAIFGRQIEVVKVLLAAQADINAQNSEGRTPLHIAVEGRQIEIAKVLLIVGANKNIADNERYLPRDFVRKGTLGHLLRVV